MFQRTRRFNVKGRRKSRSTEYAKRNNPTSLAGGYLLIFKYNSMQKALCLKTKHFLWRPWAIKVGPNPDEVDWRQICATWHDLVRSWDLLAAWPSVLCHVSRFNWPVLPPQHVDRVTMSSPDPSLLPCVARSLSRYGNRWALSVGELATLAQSRHVSPSPSSVYFLPPHHAG